jgi:peptidoglycan/xylan/chitin deacetylase (PgdA/CDA1 family)/GT2 family glycosyltransferase
VTFPLRVLQQQNRGRAQACNDGAAAARGELLLFLDDDMEADPNLLVEHDRSQREGADLVLGHVPVHPDSPRNLLSQGVGYWAESRRDRLSAPGAEIRLDDLVTGQCSISWKLFHELGGFDVSFTRQGLFGGEDLDFGYRLLKTGHHVSFNPAAISYQYYDVSPSAYLRRTFEAGRSDQELIAKHPEHGRHVWRRPVFRTRRSLLFFGPLVFAPPAVTWPLRAGAAALVSTGWTSSWIRRLFFAVRTMEHLRGARLARRSLSTGRVVVLAYHAISDLKHDPVLSRYGVPRERFAAHLDRLARRGWHFVDLDKLLSALRGEEQLAKRALLVTFDDCYADLAEASALLAARGIPAVAFAVSGRIGGTNDWDRHLGASAVELLDGDGLRAIASRGIEIGSHSMSHPMLSKTGAGELDRELSGSADQLEALGLPRPRAFAYPHGDWTPGVVNAVSEAGYEAAFTVEPGVVERGSDPDTLPRLEVLAGDTPFKLRVKVVTAGWQRGLRRRVLRLVRTTEH